MLSPQIGAYLKDDATVWEAEPMDAIMRRGSFAAYKHCGFWQSLDTVHDKAVLGKNDVENRFRRSLMRAQHKTRHVVGIRSDPRR